MRIFSRIHPGEYESKRRHLHCHRRARESSRADDIWTSAGSTTSRVSLLLIFLFSSNSPLRCLCHCARFLPQQGRSHTVSRS